MLFIDRKNAIIETLKNDKSVRVNELSEKFGVTEETVRRDLKKLESEKKIVRVHGGAYLYDGFEKGAPARLRKEVMVEEKIQLGIACVEHIEEKDIIFLDGSTTSLHIARQIKLKSLQVTIITNYLDILAELVDCKSTRLIGIGGSINQKLRTFQGPIAENNLRNYYPDKAFISCSSMDNDLELYDLNENEGIARRIMINNSNTNYLVIDHTKLSGKSTYRIDDISKIDTIVIDNMKNEFIKKKIKNLNKKLIEVS